MEEKNTLTGNAIDYSLLTYSASGRYLFLKRLLDVSVAVLAIVLLAPVFIITAIAIKLDSRGPVLYCQDRCGLKGKIFKMYKFRSMVVNADKLICELKNRNEAGNKMFKIRNDPRVTRVGRYIRKMSIDELPQLLNVLKGEMSLVGPRPPLVMEVKEYEPWHNLRLCVKPGMTGLWQVSGRNEIGFEEMVRLDLKYIRERSLLYDLKIIFRTIPLLFGDERAS